MRVFPIIPIWLMVIIVLILFYIFIRNGKKNWIDLLIIVLLFLINLRIMYPDDNALVISNNLDVLFVIDNTISMNAEDYNGSNTRLSGIKKDCKYIINKLNGAKFSLITFNNNSKIIIPYTRDINLAIESIDIMKPLEKLFAEGSSLNTPLNDIISSLESSVKKENRQRIIFFISDGEITNDDTLTSYKEISKYLTDGAVLGYGTLNGGYMKETDKYTGKTDYITYNYDFTKEKALSKIDESNLKKIAEDMNIEYVNMSKQSNINSKLNDIVNLVDSKFDDSNKSTYNDTYFVFVIPLLVLLLIKYKYLKGELL